MKNLFIFCFALFAIQLSAQTFTTYTTGDGLINNTVNCLVVDANDDLWFGTQEGISFFDGIQWTNYDINSHPDLVHNTITAIAVDSDNNLWIGTDFGVNKFDGANWTTFTEDDGLADNRVKYIAQDAEGNIWFANNDGISIFDGSDWTSYTMSDGLPFGGTNFVTFDSEGIAYLGTPLAGVLVFDGVDFSSITEDEGLLSDKIRSIAIGDNQDKWIGTSDGISVFDENDDFLFNHEFIFELPPPDMLNPIEDVQIGPDGRVWVGVYVDYLVTEGGIAMYDGAEWVNYDVDDGLAGPVVRRLDIDSQNIVWVATSTGVTKIGDLPSNVEVLDRAGSIKIYPNPASEEVTMEVPDEMTGHTFQLFNSMGMEVKRGDILNTPMTLNLGEHPAGLYFLSVGGQFVQKVLLEN